MSIYIYISHIYSSDQAIINLAMKNHHFLITSFPVQGHINPTLQLAKTLAHLGATVTFATTVRGLKGLHQSLPTITNLSYASFSDGHDDTSGSGGGGGFTTYMADLSRCGSQTLTNILHKLSDEGRPVTCLVYSLLLPWASTVARDMHVPSAFLAIQCAAAFAIYHRFFSGHGGEGDSLVDVDIEGLPRFTLSDFPTFVVPNNPMYPMMSPMMQEHIQELEKLPKSMVFLNTFQELEQEAIKALEMNKMNVISIGPLIPSAFFNDESNDKSFGGDLFLSKKEEYMQWLESKPEKSVVYVAFGSLVVMSKEQKVEILHGLMETKRPFLWVIRSWDSEEEDVKKMVEKELENGDGMIVPWCSQLEVLSHKSIACFATHCGWNSTLESLICGVPIIGCPHYSDQTTNAKLVDEVWGNGIRARINGEVVIKREELKNCLDIVMGDSDRGKEIRNNALKFRGLAMEAVKEGGSTYNNLRKVLEMEF